MLKQLILIKEIKYNEDAFGVILFTSKTMTPKLLNSIFLELGTILHFSNNKTAHGKLSEACYLGDNCSITFY